jgi:hypothetical protein
MSADNTQPIASYLVVSSVVILRIGNAQKGVRRKSAGKDRRRNSDTASLKSSKPKRNTYKIDT